MSETHRDILEYWNE